MALGAARTQPHRTRPWAHFGLAAVVCAGCTAQVEPPAFALPALDRATFDVDAGPLLATRCGDALCHGRADRPFVVYSVGRHRLDPAKTFLSSPLDPTERDRNFASTLGFVDHPTPHRTTLVRKALGQMGHKGGAVFEAPSDPPLQALAAWMSGEAARRSPP